MHKSHLTYEFFRAFFLGNADAVEERLNLLMALPVDEANDVGELVDRVLGSDGDASLLDGLCELLKSISEFAGVVKVREAVLAEKEHEFGAKSKEVGVRCLISDTPTKNSANTPSSAMCWSARSQSTSASTVATARRWPACCIDSGQRTAI